MKGGGEDRGRALLLAPAAVFLADAILTVCDPPPLPAALLDEPAHLATALLLWRALGGGADPPALLGLTLGAVLIDVDHLPKYLGWQERTGRRPAPHCLLTVAGVALAGRRLDGARRRLVDAVAFGLAAHLVRDMATGGAPIWWPLRRSVARVPYPVYVALLLGATRGLRGRWG